MQLKTKRLIARVWLIFWGMLIAGVLITLLLRAVRFWFNFGTTIQMAIFCYCLFSFVRSFIWAMRMVRQKGQ